MKEEQADLLKKASESLEAANILLSEGFPGFAASRAYYTMFYIAQAFLEGDNIAFSKHKATISAFGKLFAKTGKVPQEFHRYLIDAMTVRHQGDYAPTGIVTFKKATELVNHAEEFLRFAKQNL